MGLPECYLLAGIFVVGSTQVKKVGGKGVGFMVLETLASVCECECDR